MDSARVDIPDPSQPLQIALAEIGTQSRQVLRRGFDFLSRLTIEDLRLLVPVIKRAMLTRRPPQDESISRIPGLSAPDRAQLLAAASFLVINLTMRQEDASEFISALASAELIDPSKAAKLTSLGLFVAEGRSEFRQVLDHSNRVSQVLPNLVAVDTAVDLRVLFDGLKIEAVRPVGIVFLDTDEYHQELRFQASKLQLQALIDDLKQLLDRIETAEAWTNRG